MSWSHDHRIDSARLRDRRLDGDRGERRAVAARERLARTQCANNMRNLGLALVNYQTSKNRLPNAGTFLDDPAQHQGDPLKSNIYRALNRPRHVGRRVRFLAPELGRRYPALPRQPGHLQRLGQGQPVSHPCVVRPHGSTSNAHARGVPSIGILRCPDDYTAPPGQGNLSYVVNGGFARWHAVPVGWSGSRVDGKATNGGVLQWTPPGGTWKDNQAVCKKLGVMFLGTQTGDQPWDIATTPADITDGMSKTLLVAENTLAGYSTGTPYSGGRETNWACPLPNFAMFLGSDDVCRTARSAGDCLGGQLAPAPRGPQARAGSGPTRRGPLRTSISARASRSRARSPSPTAPIPAGPTSCSAMEPSASFRARSMAPSMRS